jgi:S-(hydroxymethyl)glutathione dehydrogenase / alcohol dehydrogenase
VRVQEHCLEAVRRGGAVTEVGVYVLLIIILSHYRWFDKGIRMMGGQVWVQRYTVHLIVLIREGKVVLDDTITHTVPLAQASKIYDIFNKKRDNGLKAVLKP